MASSSVPMAEFYSGKNVLITGGTGFIGKAIIEKIVRCLPQIKKVYVLIRQKKGITPVERLKVEIIDSPIFDRLRQQLKAGFDPLIQSKLCAVSGDICSPEIVKAESAQELQYLQQNLHMVIHSAASVSFNSPLQDAVEQNCVGTLNVLNFVQSCGRQFQSFVHISTAYVNSNRKNCALQEQLYPLDFDVEEALSAIQSATPAELEQLHLNLIGTYPNTYTLTKSMTEHLLVQRRKSVPLILFRPTIVGAAWKEPVPGWIDQVAAAGTVFLAIGMGILSILPGNPRSIADIVPVDIVVNGLLASIPNLADHDQHQVIHCGTSDPRENPLRWRIVSAVVPEYWRKHPPQRAIFPQTHFHMHQSHQLFQWMWFWRYTAPSSVFSTVANFVGQPSHVKKAAQLGKVNWKARTLAEVFKPFTETEWIFTTNFLQQLHMCMSPEEQKLFHLRTRGIYWSRYLANFCYGLKKWILKEEMVQVEDDTVEHTQLALNTGRILEWDPDHHAISFPGLFSDLSWAYTSSRKPGYTKAGCLGRALGVTGWHEDQNHEASHVPRVASLTFDTLADAIVSSPAVQAAILASDAGPGTTTRATLESEARAILRKMAAQVDYSATRKMAYFLRKIWRQMYDEIMVDEKGLERIRALKCRQPHVPVILLPTHRSYLDFLMLSYLFFAYNVPIPHIVAGEDFLGMAGMTTILRQCGAYFIRRSFKDDTLYSAVLTEYTQHLLEQGQSLEFFIEGTRSRSGKQLEPKFGVLSMIVQAYLKKRIPNAVLIPITIDYERPLEVFLHQREVLGEGKIPESMASLLKTLPLLCRNFGSIAVSFGEPLELDAFVQDHPLESEPRQLVENLGYAVTDAMSAMARCMPIHLVASLLLMYRQGISKSHLVELTDWLREQVLARGGTVVGIQGANRAYIVDRALELLREIVSSPRKDLLVPTITHRNEYQNMLGLGYYRNRIIHLFDQEGVLMCAFAAQVDKKEVKVATEEQVISDAVFLSHMLKHEFVRSPARDTAATLRAKSRWMKDRGVLDEPKRGQLCIRPEGEMLYSFLGALMWPFIDSYWIALVTLFGFHSSDSKSFRRAELLRRMQWIAETMYHEKVLGYYEACSLETLQNAISFLKDQHIIIQHHHESESKPKQELEYQFHPSYCQDQHALARIASTVYSFRRLPIGIQNASAAEFHSSKIFHHLIHFPTSSTTTQGKSKL